MPAHTRRRVTLIVCDQAVLTRRRLQLVAADAVVAAAAGRPATDRTLRGLALPYAADGRTSAGLVRASAGVVHWPTDLRRVKVFTGHDRTRPVGYVTALTETGDGLTAELHIAATPDGDSALLEAREGTRDALSVELEDVELGDDGELLSAELTLDAAAAQIADRFVRGNRTAAALNAALADITPTSTGSAATAPPQWLGEIWTPEYEQLDWANAISTGPLTSMRLTGWKRVPPGPVISPYAGDKAAVPTDGNLRFEPVDVLAHRHAVAADFDRIWVDFGDESVINTWLRLVTQDYAAKLDQAIASIILAESTVAGPADDVIGGVRLAANTLKRNGARVSYIALASDLFADYLDIPAAEAPWWLTGSSNVDLAGNSGSVNNLSVFESPALLNGSIVAGDRRAVTQYTPRGNPFTIRAVDLAHGGVDVGVFGYSAELVNDPLGVVKVTVTPTP